MLFQELGKLKRSAIMTSIILMAVGIMMVICPPQYIDTLVSALGYGMVTLAAVMIMDFLSSKKVLMNYIYLTGALLLALLGIAVLTLEDIVLDGNTVQTSEPLIQNDGGLIVGAGAIVTKDVPDYAVVVGSPAKVVKTLDKEKFEK